MPFKNRNLAKRVAAEPCVMCGWTAGRRFASHIIDEGPERDWNALSLCPNCSVVFDEVPRPLLYSALAKFGAADLPESWKTDNKLSPRAILAVSNEVRLTQ